MWVSFFDLLRYCCSILRELGLSCVEVLLEQIHCYYCCCHCADKDMGKDGDGATVKTTVSESEGENKKRNGGRQPEKVM